MFLPELIAVTLFCATVQGTVKLCPVETVQGIWIDVDQLHFKMVFDSIQSLVWQLQNIVKENVKSHIREITRNDARKHNCHCEYRVIKY